ncbi:hypothetical protein [Paenibacillus sp. 481]|uniref:hypothetical protein n=1 Tax=Paenibacillus sp. 481 TaxID=2835869 RepID=UPI001E5143EB|nr:hypothetical protein [Paenibacillus sp. 481]UHA74506.1 hypothetical protein KIK04_05235 [Paenibacillus sp. 481]
MNVWESEQAVKIDLISAIIRSQHALATMLEQVAELNQYSEPSVKQLGDNIRLLSNYQQGLCKMVTGWRWRTIMKGTPAEPWLIEACRLQRVSVEGVQEEGVAEHYGTQTGNTTHTGAEDESTKTSFREETRTIAL